ncbi:MAG: hypothetical protein DLM63_05020 [Solirubrobacterales bacterium]|nr:MAG: hypothetical protein DLM63_05020 [Solirubrobacterales bacterium]
MRTPIRAIDGNVVFGAQLSDAWAIYHLELESYEGLTIEDKLRLWAELASFGYAIRADFQFLRVSGTWSLEHYATGARNALDPRHGYPTALDAHLAADCQALAEHQVSLPRLYLGVHLADPAASPLDRLAEEAGRAALRPRGVWRQLRELGAERDPRALSQRQRRALLGRERRAFETLSRFFAARRAETLELQWLIRRAFCAGLGEPEIDALFTPRALEVQAGDELHWRPLEIDLLRLFRSPIVVGERALRISSELGTSHQALLALGALPESAEFPGRQAELLSAPLDDVDFPIDVGFSAFWLPNERAARLVRNKLVHADHILSEEAAGEHGASSATEGRPHAARALRDYLEGEVRPPLLIALSTLRVSAPSADELERRVTAVAEAYRPVRVHRPYGEQLRLFRGLFPGQKPALADFCEHLLLEQMAGLMPLAQHAVGAPAGLLIGRTAFAGRPVLADLRQASHANRPPATLLSGTLGSGKTMLLQLLLFGAFLLGSRVVDIDPKGDHALHRLLAARFGPGAVEEIVLGSDSIHRGLLDPLRVAPEGAREDAAASFFLELLHPCPPSWRTAIKRALKTVAAAPPERRTCAAAVAQLRSGDGVSREVADALEVYADGGLAQLGFASASDPPREAGAAPFTYIQIRRLPRPLPGTPRDELTEEQRVGVAVMRLLASYAMHLMGEDRTRHKVLGFDEAWFLLRDATGRELIEQLNRWGRSEFATPILVTHLASDAIDSQNLIGTRFVFGQETTDEAAAGLRMLRLDPRDEGLLRWLLQAREGRCLLRDLDERVAKVKINLDAHPELLETLSTTPSFAL